MNNISNPGTFKPLLQGAHVLVGLFLQPDTLLAPILTAPVPPSVQPPGPPTSPGVPSAPVHIWSHLQPNFFDRPDEDP